MRSTKTQSEDLKDNLEQLGKTPNYCFQATSAIDMTLLTDKLNLKCYVLYETKELLTITKIYITIINILVFIVSIVIVIIIIIITIITIIIALHDFWRQIFAHTFFIYLFFVKRLQHFWIKITWAIKQTLICS